MFFFFLVERYDPKMNKWTMMPAMSTRRKHLGCAVYNKMIYAVGGRDDCTELSSAERYNPHTNQWSPIVAMTSRRSGVSSETIFFLYTIFALAIDLQRCFLNDFYTCGFFLLLNLLSPLLIIRSFVTVAH